LIVFSASSRSNLFLIIFFTPYSSAQTKCNIYNKNTNYYNLINCTAKFHYFKSKIERGTDIEHTSR
jgi:hypothetical protein